MSKNLFTYEVKNQFVDNKETEILINYCGRQIGIAFFYLDDVYIDFTENQPMIPMDEWHKLETILKRIKQTCPVS